MPPGRPRKTADDVLFKSAEMIGWAIGGLEREIVTTRAKLAALTDQVTKLRARAGVRGTGGGSAAMATAAVADAGAPAGGRKKRRRTMSPEARKRISEMMKKRWAERRRGK